MKKLILVGLIILSGSFVKAEVTHTPLTSIARYQIIYVQGNTIRLELETGRCWQLVQTKEIFWWNEILENDEIGSALLGSRKSKGK